MKTGTNFKKTAIRSGAVVVSFVLISFTVSAQEFWWKLITNSSFNEIAVAMIETDRERGSSGNTTSSGAEWERFENAFDPALELEGWMSDRAHFEVIGFEELTDQEDAAIKTEGLSDEGIFASGEEALRLEGWMTDETLWGR